MALRRPSTVTSPLVLALVLACATTFVTACGGDGGGNGGPPDETTVDGGTEADHPVDDHGHDHGDEEGWYFYDEVPEFFPSEVPLPDWTVVGVVEMVGSRINWEVDLRHPADPRTAASQIRSFYVDRGFEVVGALDGFGPDDSMLFFRRDPWHLSASVNDVDGATRVAISVSDDPRAAYQPDDSDPETARSE